MLATAMASDLLPTVISHDSRFSNSEPLALANIGVPPLPQSGYSEPPIIASETSSTDLDSSLIIWDASLQLSANSAIPTTSSEPQMQPAIYIQQNNYIQIASPDFDTFVHSADLLAQYVRQTVAEQVHSGDLITSTLPHTESIQPRVVYAQEIGPDGFPIHFEYPAADDQKEKRHKRRAFDDDGRKKVKQVRQMRACIRCRMNKRSVRPLIIAKS